MALNLKKWEQFARVVGIHIEGTKPYPYMNCDVCLAANRENAWLALSERKKNPHSVPVACENHAREYGLIW